MRKYLLGVIIFFYFAMPIKVGAMEISKVDLTGKSEVTEYSTLEINVDLNFSNMTQSLTSTTGIWTISYELSFNDEIFTVVGIDTENFNSKVYKDLKSGKYYVFSEIKNSPSNKKYCMNGQLYCSNYSAKITFLTKKLQNKEGKSEIVKVSSVDVKLLDMKEDKTYTMKDAITLNSSIVKELKVNIQPAEEGLIIIYDPPLNDIVVKGDSFKPTQKKNTTPTVKSSNKTLTTLEIDGVTLDFDKNKTDYTIYVDEGIHELNIKATPEDNKATYQVIGADDLRKNNIVKVEVTAQDKTKQTYYIRVKYNQKQNMIGKDSDESEIDKDNEIERTEKKDKEIVKTEILKWLGIGFGVIFVIAIIAFIISKIKDRSIDKKLDALDDD